MYALRQKMPDFFHPEDDSSLHGRNTRTWYQVLDTLNMDDMAFDLHGLQFTMKDGTLKGLKNTIIDGAEWDAGKKHFTINFHTDVSVKGAYTAGGRVLILPITGDGQLKIKLKNLQIKMQIDFDTVKKGDNEHVKPKKYSFEFEVKDDAHFHLTNLFNGNKQLSEAMLTFLNDNWKQISSEFGQPLVNNVAKKLYKNIGVFFDKMPLNEIANV
ncbi:circadian clock-controlled protein daywake-like [Anticarsia gemmatalis]|uniref:circadian clock-controlled protein daywake-like n=1 Tax=Anticarsia gemmatalis TaxID=129554 RepID=UPI003F777EF4